MLSWIDLLPVDYFNQDYEVLFGNVNETLANYKANETIEEQLRTQSEIDYLLMLSLPDAELQDILLNKFDCCYYYPYEWPSSEEWLRHIRREIG
ncbi:contact-dependent growth inhibition system immunity protein [Rahnella laticis]|uniref:contact-dependent growth inhibition system immunity protein n=1 Tax=Rahnella laticis TaxID=2787622 RepID=UPI0018A2FB01|nr:contact-dependent growth inhibition system immunity protein [Rahnella laticis]MBF7995942.1 hypothetical protein [Rahnella laticis]